MSTANIIFKGYTGESSYVVIFSTRDGSRAYEYPSTAGMAIEAGADPRAYRGQEIPVPSALVQFADSLFTQAEKAVDIIEEITAATAI